MHRRAALALLAASALAPAVARARTADFPEVEDTSFTAANGERTMRLSAVIPAEPEAVWKAVSTAEGWKGWAVKTAYVDFREGGQIETSYKDAAKGDPANIINQIIAISPNRLLVWRNVQAPPGFQDAELFGRIISSLKLEPIGPGRTRVTLSGAGYAPGAAYDRLYGFFLKGNAYTLDSLRRYLSPKA